MWLHRLDAADASCGGKAIGLARLLAAGLPVPDGFVIDDRAFRHVVGDLDPASDAIGHVLAEAAQRIATAELPAELVAEVLARAAQLGPLAVRSSATIEDGEAGAAAGVFSSKTAVPPGDVWAAIRAVWSSALTPLAVSYARRRGGRIAIGVIVQRFVPGDLVTIYTRALGSRTSTDMMIQRGDALSIVPRDAPPFNELRTLALAAATAIEAPSGADVEIIETESGQHAVVQARPLVHREPEVRVSAPPMVTALLVADGRRWTWDIAHNPDPLSTAQAELVKQVDRAEVAPWSMRVCGGYLYVARREDGSELPASVPTTIDELDARVAGLEAAMQAALDGGGTDPPLAEALDRYTAFYRIWATELSPLIARLRATLSPDQLVGARPSAVEVTLLAAARGELTEAEVFARIGVLSPAWDVAVPTFAERPELVLAAIERARGVAVGPRPTLEPERDLARAAADLGERDDVWFARAQWLVRRAILAKARELAIDPDDAFWTPLGYLVTATHLVTAPEIDRDELHRRAAGARSAAVRAGRWLMPVVVGGTPEPDRPPSRTFHGIGSGPRVKGRVVRSGSLASIIEVTPTDIVVTRAVTPALAVLVVGCAALVSETGGLLDHGAAMARELGIPCVVGCKGAWGLADGLVVTVDGDAGTVDVDGA